MRVLDLFSGIGGFSLGLERAGMETIAFCEIDPYARAVLKKHWPGVPCYDDVRTLTAERLRADGIVPDVICGGFHCQDISTAGKGAGLAGERSGLWFEYHRIIKEVRPQYVIIENVSALRSRGLDEVLRSLAEIGYDAEWHCISASAVGAPHRRDRIWIVAHPQRQSNRWRGVQRPGENFEALGKGTPDKFIGASENVAHPDQPRLEGRDSGILQERASKFFAVSLSACGIGQIWLTEPNVGRVANGVPNRVDRLKCLGNAVVPQIPQIIGEAIMKVEKNEIHACHD